MFPQEIGILLPFGAWRSRLARCVWDAEVVGSSPTAPTFLYLRKNDSPTSPVIRIAAIRPIRFRSLATYWYWLCSCSGLVGVDWLLLVLTRLNAAELRGPVLPRRDVRPAIVQSSPSFWYRRIIDLPTWQSLRSSVYRPNKGNTRLGSRLLRWWIP